LSSQNEKVLRITRKFERSLKHLSERVKGIPEAEQKVFSETHDLVEKLHLVVDTQEKLTKKLKKLEKVVLKPSVKPESGIETVIPLKKEKALEPLTDTEFRVLNVLATDGKKTSPEIQNEIRLTREHTARLMKKLYQKGYLERDIKKIPYVYWIKQEMLKLLKKA
jgi:predicted DNA-binding transcriptional regulator